MAVVKRGTIWWYKFRFEGQRIQKSAKTTKKSVAKRMEKEHHLALREAHVAEHHAKVIMELIMTLVPIATIERWLEERRVAERAAKKPKP